VRIYTRVSHGNGEFNNTVVTILIIMEMGENSMEYCGHSNNYTVIWWEWQQWMPKALA